MQLESSVLSVSHVGEKRAKVLNKIGIYTVKDMLFYFPRDYHDRSIVTKISEIEADVLCTFRGFIEKEPENIRIKDKIITKIKVKDETGAINVSWYNQSYLKNTFSKGEEYYFIGKLKSKYGKKEVMSPDFEKVRETEQFSAGRIVPIYALTEGVSQKLLRSIIKNTLGEANGLIEEILPYNIRKEYKLCERHFAVSNIHFPENDDSFYIARRRLVFEELFIMQLLLFKLKFALDKKGIVFENIDEYKNQILDKFSFKFTSAQMRVLNEVFVDFESGIVMNRLVQGDVGSGKTAVALASAFVAIKNGFQVALMAPTEVLASQHFEYFSSIFSDMGIETVLLTGSLKKSEKDKALKDIADGNAKMIIGTHAVIQKNVEFQNLGFVITDEQHRFGVRQREVLSTKGENPHVLVMTATPIPRSLALILYGDLNISVIDELPPGRQKIDTFYVTSSYRPRIFNFIKGEIDKGRQAYIICSMIDESEKISAEAVMEYTEKIKNDFFNEYNVSFLHGKMKPNEKQDIMNDFSLGKINILVSTTVIEVGINVPNSTIMLVENAEKFGLAQLHQLRGRVGRGKEKSYCILISDSKTKVTKERMNVMKKTGDGFEISEMDLKLRGPGDFFGTKQHGIPEMKIANLYKDINILKEAQGAVKNLLENDSDLKNEENINIKREISRYYNNIKINI